MKRLLVKEISKSYRCTDNDLDELWNIIWEKSVIMFRRHRRIQDFVRGGGGQGPLGPRGGGGPRPSWPAPHYLGEQYFVGRGGAKAPVAPPWIRAWEGTFSAGTSSFHSEGDDRCYV